MKSGRRTLGLIFCLPLLVVLVAYYFPWLTGQWSFYKSDVTYYYEPFTRFIIDSFKEGRLPLWNPYLYCGMSQVSVPSPGPFYLPILFFAFGNFSQGLALFLIFHQLIAGLGAFLLVISLGWGVFAATLAGLSFALCGYMFSMVANYTLLATMTWLPLLLYAVRSIDANVNRANVLRMFGASLATAMLISAGRPEVSVPAGLLVGSYVLVTAFGAWREDSNPRLAVSQSSLRLISLLCGVIMAMPAVLPALEWARISPRAQGLDLKWVLMWSANWYDCWSVILAQPFGDLTYLGNKYLNVAASRASAIPYVASSYIGPFIATFAIWGLFDRTWRWRPFVLGIFVGSLLMALGSNTPVAPFICHLSPMLAAFRYPVKLIIIPAMAIIFMAARGALLSGQLKVPQGALITSAVAWTLVLLLGAICIYAPGLNEVVLQNHWVGTGGITHEVMRLALQQFGKAACLGAALGFLCIANYFAFRRGFFNSGWYCGITVAILLVVLLNPAVTYARRGAVGDFLERPSLVAERLKRLLPPAGKAHFMHRAICLYFDPLTPPDNFLKEQNIEFQQGFYLYSRLMLLPNGNLGAKVPYSFGYEAAETGRFKDLFISALGESSQNRQRNPKLARSDAPMARFCRMSTARYATTQAYREHHMPVPKLDSRYFTLKEEDQNTNLRIYETKGVVPRLYFANKLKRSSSWSDFRTRFMEETGDDAFDETYVGADLDVSVADSDGQGEEAAITVDDPEHVVLQAKSNGHHLLVLIDQWYPGWSATVDGVPVHIERVNYFARGIALTPGEHQIEFRYQPTSLYRGLVSTGVVLFFYAMAVLLLTRSASARMLRRQRNHR